MKLDQVSVNSESKDIIKLLISFQEQTSHLLEEVVSDNRTLKKELNELRNIIVKYELLQKDMDDFVFERRECQKMFREKLGSLGTQISVVRDQDTDKMDRLKESMNSKIENLTKDITILKDTIITPIRLEAAKAGAKYGIITSVGVFCIVLIINFVVHWIESKVKSGGSFP